MRRGRSVGEGWLIAAALLLVLALALGFQLNRRPRAQTAAPVHCVDAEALSRAETIDLNSASA